MCCVHQAHVCPYAMWSAFSDRLPMDIHAASICFAQNADAIISMIRTFKPIVVQKASFFIVHKDVFKFHELTNKINC